MRPRSVEPMVLSTNGALRRGRSSKVLKWSQGATAPVMEYGFGANVSKDLLRRAMEC